MMDIEATLVAASLFKKGIRHAIAITYEGKKWAIRLTGPSDNVGSGLHTTLSEAVANVCASIGMTPFEIEDSIEDQLKADNQKLINQNDALVKTRDYLHSTLNEAQAELRKLREELANAPRREDFDFLKKRFAGIDSPAPTADPSGVDLSDWLTVQITNQIGAAIQTVSISGIQTLEEAHQTALLLSEVQSTQK